MDEPMGELRLIGRSASAGFAVGPIALLSRFNVMVRKGGEPAAEAAALRDAIATALEHLSQLAAHAKSDGADILAFQIAMLEDETLAAPAFAAISEGASADRAWRTALDAEIGGYDNAEDEHFRARASDLRDICDRVLAALSGEVTEPSAPSGAIVIGEDLTPSRFLATDWSAGGGIALTRGSASGHVATLARARGVPMIVGLDLDLGCIGGRGEALIDGESATLYLDPTAHHPQDPSPRAPGPRTGSRIARKSSGCGPLSPPTELRSQFSSISPIPPKSKPLIPRVATGSDWCAPSSCSTARTLPDEETQYLRLSAARRMGPRQAGDHSNPRRRRRQADPRPHVSGESNPFLGLRGIRLSLAKPEPFRTQLRALCRAAVHGAIEVMLPMVTCRANWRWRAEFWTRSWAALKAGGHRLPPPASRHHGGSARCRHRDRRVRRRLLFDRLERSHPICHGGRARP